MKGFFLRSSNRGFTILEIMIVVTITVILSTMILGYNRSSETQIVLYRDQATIVGIINQAKSFAIEKYNQLGISGYVACAFGVHFEGQNTFILYRALTSGSRCTPPVTNFAYDGTDAERIQTLSLDPRLQFYNLPIGGTDIAFIPPELTVVSNQSLPINILLQTADGSLKAPIQVGVGGQIVTQ